MASNVIFGPGVNLPSIEGLKSGCEEELNLLLKEIDLAFERKYKDLLSEKESLKASNEQKHAECENLKSAFKSKIQSSKQNFEENTKHLVKEIEKLKNENILLKRENSSLQSRIQIGAERENQLESLRGSLDAQQEENSKLKEKVQQLSQQQSNLQENYARLLHLLSSENKVEGAKDRRHVVTPTSHFMDDIISQETEKYLKEETEHCNELQSKIDAEIEELRRTLTESTLML